MLITTVNPTTEQNEKTYLSDAISAGVTTLGVKNNNNFTQNSRIMIGEMGREKTEIVTVTGAVTAGTSLTIGATTFPHEADDPVTVLRFDQVKVYRSVDGEFGNYIYLATTDLDVDNDTLTTSYDDTTGVAGYYYKVTLYHSISTLESALSAAMLGTGFSRGQVGFFINEFLNEVNDKQEQTTDRTEILGWLNEVNDDLQTTTRRPYDFLRTRTALAVVADAETVSIPSAMWKLDGIYYNFVDATTDEMRPLRIISLEEFKYRFQDQDADSDDNIKYIAIDTAVNKFRLGPRPATSQGGALYLYYWKFFDEITSESDVLETPTPRIYKMYCLSKFYGKKAVSDGNFLQIADRRAADYAAEKIKLPRANNKDAGSPQSFKFLPQTFKGLRRY